MNTRSINLLLMLISSFFVFSCESTPESKFPVDKKFWTPEDYDFVIHEISYNTPKGDEFPRFSNPNNAIVIKKLVDHQNYSVVLDDSELGLKHRSDVAQAFFDQYRDMSNAYNVFDKQDKYIYSDELVEIEKFGLGLQIKYFKLGNDNIIEHADNPESGDIQSTLRSNEATVIRNFDIYLDNINKEKSFQESSIPSYAEGIDVYFIELVNTFPKGDYDGMMQKANLMLKKAKSENIKSALQNLITKIESIKTAAN